MPQISKWVDLNRIEWNISNYLLISQRLMQLHDFQLVSVGLKGELQFPDAMQQEQIMQKFCFTVLFLPFTATFTLLSHV